MAEMPDNTRRDEQRATSNSPAPAIFQPSPCRAEAPGLEGDVNGSASAYHEDPIIGGDNDGGGDGGGSRPALNGLGGRYEGQEGYQNDDGAGVDFHIDSGSEPEFEVAYTDGDDDNDDNDDDDDDGSGGDGSSQTSASFNAAAAVPFMPMPMMPHRANAFAPPFYNRPPTPLPPSPSLTSLLRPTFSTTTSRPTTPDSSDIDVTTTNTNETGAAVVAKSARTATAVPRASPRVPTYEYYGFVLYLTACLAFLMYLLWSYLPSPFLHQVGVYYYPNRWWSLAIPSYLVMLVLYIYVALAAYNIGYLTLPMESIENIVDDAANVAVIDSKGRRRAGGSAKLAPEAFTALTVGENVPRRNVDWRELWSEGTDAVMDVPVGGVCEVLYGSANACDKEHPD